MPIDAHQYIELNGNTIEWTKDFKYLGSHIASSEIDIRARKGLAWRAFWKMKDVFCSKTLPIRLKINIFEAAVISILLYGCESWIINKRANDALNSFATNCYRIILGIKKLDKVSNKRVYEQVGKDQITLQIHQRQLRFVGHSLRRGMTFPPPPPPKKPPKEKPLQPPQPLDPPLSLHSPQPLLQHKSKKEQKGKIEWKWKDNPDQISEFVLYAPEKRHGQRRQGAPRIQYHTYIGKLINSDVQPTLNEIRELASNREEWRQLVADCAPVLFAADR